MDPIPGSALTIHTRDWSCFGILAGFYLRIPKEYSPFYIKLQCGIITVASPEIEYASLAPGGDLLNFNQSSVYGQGFVYGGGMGFYYPVYKNFSLGLCADFLLSRPKFEDVKYTLTGTGIPSVNVKKTFTKDFDYLTCKAALVFNMK
jgi:hypothetical protein